MQDEFDLCLVLNARMAARAVTRLADRKLRSFGITAAQFSIMTSLIEHPGRSVTQMASAIAMERSTLSRNLALLERRGLIAWASAERGNSRIGQLTSQGAEMVEQVLPAWREQQAEMRAALAAPDFSTVIAALRQVARL
jgi:DNA-binding MarR family transcriptional regulator